MQKEEPDAWKNNGPTGGQDHANNHGTGINTTDPITSVDTNAHCTANIDQGNAANSVIKFDSHGCKIAPAKPMSGRIFIFYLKF